MSETLLLLSAVANRLIEGLVVPIFEKFNLDKFYIMYISWLVSAVLIGLAQLNMFADVFPSPVVGYVLTALVCGLGSNIINDLVDFIRDIRNMLKRG